MENEHLNGGPEPSPKSAEEHSTTDDLKFMRSVVEKSYRKVKPETHSTIMAGLVCMTAYISIHFLAKHNLYKWIAPLYLSLIGFILCYSVVTGFILIKRQKESGFVPQLPWQLGGICLIIMFPIIFWDRMGLFKNIFCEAGFIYAMGLSMIMGIIGILYSKEWLFGGMLIFAGMLLAFFTKDYTCPFIILGLSTGAGLIIPAIIADRNYRKQEKSYE